MNADESLLGKASAISHPSLALTKYWGKKDVSYNIPETPSLALTLGGLSTTTHVKIYKNKDSRANSESIYIDDILMDSKRFSPFFHNFRSFLLKKSFPIKNFDIHVKSSSNFPSKAGFASSSSGFAALATACAAALDIDSSLEELSSLARMGSASAARAFWGGFTFLRSGSSHAEPLYSYDWWPKLRVIAVVTQTSQKKLSSRKAMIQAKETSPFYKNWIEDSHQITNLAVQTLKERNLNTLGPLIRLSYMRMFSTMFSSNPPLIYWIPESLMVIQLCEDLRNRGIPAWETMDAGPQVKIFCEEEHIDSITESLKKIEAKLSWHVCFPGKGTEILKT